MSIDLQNILYQKINGGHEILLKRLFEFHPHPLG